MSYVDFGHGMLVIPACGLSAGDGYQDDVELILPLLRVSNDGFYYRRRLGYTSRARGLRDT